MNIEEEILNIKSFALNTYIDSCNGMCKRVLKDIEELNYSAENLISAYANDKSQGRDYSAIIELGKIMAKLEEITK